MPSQHASLRSTSQRGGAHDTANARRVLSQGHRPVVGVRPPVRTITGKVATRHSRWPTVCTGARAIVISAPEQRGGPGPARGSFEPVPLDVPSAAYRQLSPER